MAITDGIGIGCSDLQAVGGTRHILIREWKVDDLVAVAGASNTVFRIQEAGGADANWGVYESKIESSSLTFTASNEGKDTTTFECNLTFNLPKLDRLKAIRLKELEGKCLMIIVIDSNNDANPYANNWIFRLDLFRKKFITFPY